MEQRNSCIPLLSIVIATRNRIPYAISAIQSILEIPDPRLELVIQDNSDSRELEAYVHANICDNRLRYRYTPPPFSSIDNFNAAVELARGEYLCLIGDDDGVNPEIMEAAEWAQREDLDSLAVRESVNYLWHGTNVRSTLFTKVTGGTLQIGQFRGYLIDAEIKKEMRNLIRNGALYYQSFKLPKLYHGLMNRRCLEAVHEKTGAYFGGLSPDIYSSLAIACLAKRVVITDYPLTIPGTCGVSSSIQEGKLKKLSKELKDAPHFRDRGEYHWCELVPRIYSVETIWADSGIAALRAMDREDLVTELNVVKLAAYCIAANRGVVKPVLSDMFRGLRLMGKNPVLGAVQFVWSLLTILGPKLPRRIWYRFLLIIRMRVNRRIDGLENMVDVSHALTHYLRENGYRFSDCVRRRTEMELSSSKS